MSGWRTVEEYVRYMVPRIGYRATAAALNTDVAKLRASYPDIEATNTRGVDVTHDYATSAAAIAKRRARNKAKFADVTLRCARCGAEVQRTSANQKFCPECALAVRRAKANESNKRRYRETHPKRGRQDLGEMVCDRCGKTIKRMSTSQRYCENCRLAAQREQQAAYREKQKALRRLRPPTIIRCERCGKEMVRRAANHRYCAECAKVARVFNAARARERAEALRADSSPDAGETE